LYKYLTIIIIGLLIIVYFFSLPLKETRQPSNPFPDDLFVGITADGNLSTTIRLINKVKDYTNMLVILNPEIVKNKKSINQVCDYAHESGLSFFVHMSHPSYWNFNYNPFDWYYYAKEKYGEKFLGYYLYDEPGGNQLDQGPFREYDNETMPYDYRDAANTYVYYLYVQMRDFIKFDKLVTSDYGLFWFDYEAGYDTVFCEFGENRPKQTSIPQCRGAAKLHNKTWGVIITWSYDSPPYIQNPDRLYDDLILAYQTGANYITVFNYPVTGPYGLLTEEHLNAIKEFKIYVANNFRNNILTTPKIAYVIPENYGWGLRTPTDKIWGVWEADNKAPTIWNSLNNMINDYGYNFDIIVDSNWTRLFAKNQYSTLFWWNGTIQQLN
jgi:hypothetical protein